MSALFAVLAPIALVNSLSTLPARIAGVITALAAALTLLVGVIYIVFYILKLGWIADLIPDPVLKGFV